MSILNYAKQSSWPNGFGFQQSPIDLRQATTTADTDMTILSNDMLRWHVKMGLHKSPSGFINPSRS